MSTNSELLREAEATLYTTLDENHTLAPAVAQRIDRLENFQLKDNVLHFTLERHPHLFGRESKGMSRIRVFHLSTALCLRPRSENNFSHWREMHKYYCQYASLWTECRAHT
jgi:hypothetical protein